MSNHHSVIVILEAKQDKETELESVLQEIVQTNRSENTCLECRLHKSKDNASQFILYELWESQEKHQEQCIKPHIKAHIDTLKNLMANYQAFSANPCI